jgi:hypothetical protein
MMVSSSASVNRSRVQALVRCSVVGAFLLQAKHGNLHKTKMYMPGSSPV